MGLGRTKINPQTIGFAALVVLLAGMNGAGTARAVWRAVAAYEKRKARERRKAGQSTALGFDTMKVVLSRLQKDGLVEKTGTGLWRIAERAKALVVTAQAREEKTARLKIAPKDTVVIFDVPEKEHKKRAYLRIELVALGFQLLQKSVWIGPGPLPREFIDYLRREDLFPHVHVFGIKKRGTISSAFANLK